MCSRARVRPHTQLGLFPQQSFAVAGHARAGRNTRATSNYRPGCFDMGNSHEQQAGGQRQQRGGHAAACIATDPDAMRRFCTDLWNRRETDALQVVRTESSCADSVQEARRGSRLREHSGSMMRLWRKHNGRVSVANRCNRTESHWQTCTCCTRAASCSSSADTSCDSQCENLCDPTRRCKSLKASMSGCQWWCKSAAPRAPSPRCAWWPSQARAFFAPPLQTRA